MATRPPRSEGGNRDVIVIGASMGGIEAIRQLLEGLPGDLPAALFVVQHTADHGPGLLAQVLGRSSRLPVVTAAESQRFDRGRVYVAPPDLHLIATITSRAARAAGERVAPGDRSAVPLGRGKLHEPRDRRPAHRDAQRRDVRSAGDQALRRAGGRAGSEGCRLRRHATERPSPRGGRSRPAPSRDPGDARSAVEAGAPSAPRSSRRDTGRGSDRSSGDQRHAPTRGRPHDLADHLPRVPWLHSRDRRGRARALPLPHRSWVHARGARRHPGRRLGAGALQRLPRSAGAGDVGQPHGGGRARKRRRNGSRAAAAAGAELRGGADLLRDLLARGNLSGVAENGET
jgi:hypothetical protein